MTTIEPPPGDDRAPDHEQPSVAPSERPDLDAIEAKLAEVEAALARLDDATYGSCATCGTPLEDAVLEADPTARICPAHLDLTTP